MKKFLNSAEENLKNANGKEAIMAELADHFETKKELYIEIGWGEEESEAKADEAMGDGEIIGQRLSSIHEHSGARQMLFIGVAFIITVVVPFTLSMTAISDFPETFIRPLIAAALSFIFLFIFTALALKQKTVLSSIVVLACMAADYITLQRFAYPIANLLLLGKKQTTWNDMVYGALLNDYHIYIYLFTGLLLMFIIVPNIFNIYHALCIKRMTNTKKQNKMSKQFAAYCLVMCVIFGALVLPLNMLNNYTVNEEQKIRSEMISIVRELERSFDGDVGNFKSYIENSEYDFYKEENEPKATHYFLARGNYGLWVETSCGDKGNSFYAEAKVQNVNCSQKDVFIDSGEAEKLAACLGDDGYKELTLETSNCYYMTADEIFDEMSKINFTAYSVFVNENEAEYGYEWFSDIYLYVTFGHDYYTFTFKNGKCVDYVYTLD